MKHLIFCLVIIFTYASSSNAIPAENLDDPDRNIKKYLGPSLTGALSLGSRRDFGGELNLGLAYGQGMTFIQYGLTAGVFSKDERWSVGATAGFIGIISGRASLSYSQSRLSNFTDLKVGVGALLAVAYMRIQRDNRTGGYEGEVGIEFEFPILGAF